MEELPRKRDLWDKVGVVLQSSGGLLTAVTVAIIGLVGSSYLKDRELSDTNTRIYLELTSKREESESALRKDMFVNIIQSFLRSGNATLDERVLNLELLSYNFHESLNLKPLFVYMERQIISSKDPGQKDYLDRLYKVASEISRKQLLVLEGAGQKADRNIDFENFKQNPGGFPIEPATMTLEDVKRQFSLFVLSADQKNHQIKVRLEIQSAKDGSTELETSSVEFSVGYFDFPMIDNTRLTHDQRVAVVLNALEDSAADITLAYFPGSYSSLKDKASLEEVIQNLTRTNNNLSRSR